MAATVESDLTHGIRPRRAVFRAAEEVGISDGFCQCVADVGPSRNVIQCPEHNFDPDRLFIDQVIHFAGVGLNIIELRVMAR